MIEWKGGRIAVVPSRRIRTLEGLRFESGMSAEDGHRDLFYSSHLEIEVGDVSMCVISLHQRSMYTRK